MKRIILSFLGLILVLSWSWLAFSQPVSEPEEIKLAVFYPTKGTIRDLQALKEIGFINLPNLKVIGIYHFKEASDYQEARKYVEDNRIDWFSFHPIRAAIDEKTIFMANDCSRELAEIFQEADGIIFFGGPDIPPSLYGEKTNQLTEIEDPYRHYLEISAIYHLLGGFKGQALKPLLESKPEFPILGICLGAQSLNVGTGGTLIQDIWSEVYGLNYVEDILALGPERWHNNPFIKLYPGQQLIGFNFHWIKLLPDGFFVKTLGFSEKDRPIILSSHHQAFKKLGKGFKVVATSPDGKIMEAIHHTRFPNVLGIQFHPEHYRLWDKTLQIKQRPDDQSFNCWELLNNNPPSLEFHRRLWNWFCQAMKKNHSLYKSN
ncbi:MAG: gamma-glutamyl-gamma-aminobutyrate hydrolase family protein [Candidatus Saccharicenans sp.]